MHKGHTKADLRKNHKVIIQELIKQFQVGKLTIAELWAAIEEEMTIERCQKDCQDCPSCQELHKCC
jgi:hypothetical protein